MFAVDNVPTRLSAPDSSACAGGDGEATRAAWMFGVMKLSGVPCLAQEVKGRPQK